MKEKIDAIIIKTLIKLKELFYFHNVNINENSTLS